MSKFYQYPLSGNCLVAVSDKAAAAWHRAVRKTIRPDAYRVVKVSGGVMAFDTLDELRMWRGQE